MRKEYDWPAMYAPRAQVDNGDGDVVVYGEIWPSACLWIVPGTYVE